MLGSKESLFSRENRNGKSDNEGIENCAVGLDPLIKLAEKKKSVTPVMELLNSKIDHKDYQCDHTLGA